MVSIEYCVLYKGEIWKRPINSQRIIKKQNSGCLWGGKGMGYGMRKTIFIEYIYIFFNFPIM